MPVHVSVLPGLHCPLVVTPDECLCRLLLQVQNAKQMNSGLKHVVESGIEEFRLPEVLIQTHCRSAKNNDTHSFISSRTSSETFKTFCQQKLERFSARSYKPAESV